MSLRGSQSFSYKTSGLRMNEDGEEVFNELSSLKGTSAATQQDGGNMEWRRTESRGLARLMGDLLGTFRNHCR